MNLNAHKANGRIRRGRKLSLILAALIIFIVAVVIFLVFIKAADIEGKRLSKKPEAVMPVTPVTALTSAASVTALTSAASVTRSTGSDLVYSDDDRLMEQAFPFDSIPTACKVGSLVDIKLYDPLGVDPVIISKVEIVERNANILSMYLNQEEQENLKQSIKEGAVYILLYGNNNQKPYVGNYVPDYGGVNGR